MCVDESYLEHTHIYRSGSGSGRSSGACEAAASGGGELASVAAAASTGADVAVGAAASGVAETAAAAAASGADAFAGAAGAEAAAGVLAAVLTPVIDITTAAKKVEPKILRFCCEIKHFFCVLLCVNP